MKYYDIHTHQSSSDDAVVAIKNVIAGKDLALVQGFFSVGVHPWYISEQAFDQMQTQVLSKNCLAIGECGLDLRPEILVISPFALQETCFLKQIALSEQYQKPLIIHCVKCFDKLLQLKKQINPEQPWIIHGFAKNKALAVQLVNAGFYLSFGSALLKSQTNQLAIKHVPLNKVFFETDEAPNNIKEIYGAAASILQISLKELQGHVADNFKRVF